MSRNYIHVSFDEVSELIPRIPESRCEGEDDTINYRDHGGKKSVNANGFTKIERI